MDFTSMYFKDKSIINLPVAVLPGGYQFDMEAHARCCSVATAEQIYNLTYHLWIMITKTRTVRNRINFMT